MIFGIKWLARMNNGLTTWKVLLPILTIIVMFGFKFHGSNFSKGGGFFIKGAEVKSIMLAIPNGGIVFALLGFEQAVQIGGESKNPKRDLARSVIISILLGSAIYLLVQIAFIGALDPKLLTEAKTWTTWGRPTTTPRSKRSTKRRSTRWPRSPASRGWPCCCGSTRSSRHPARD